jgi:hypothetical protein
MDTTAPAGRQPLEHGPGRARPGGTGAAALPTSPPTTRRPAGPAHPQLCHTHPPRCRCPSPAPGRHQHGPPDRTIQPTHPPTGTCHTDGWRDRLVRSSVGLRVIALGGAAGQAQAMAGRAAGSSRDAGPASRLARFPGPPCAAVAAAVAEVLLLRELVEEHVASATRRASQRRRPATSGATRSRGQAGHRDRDRDGSTAHEPVAQRRCCAEASPAARRRRAGAGGGGGSGVGLQRLVHQLVRPRPAGGAAGDARDARDARDAGDHAGQPAYVGDPAGGLR